VLRFARMTPYRSGQAGYGEAILMMLSSRLPLWQDVVPSPRIGTVQSTDTSLFKLS